MKALESFRSQLDQIDEELVSLLGRRINIILDVARYKRENGIPMMQSGRVAEVKERCARIGSEHGLDPDFVRKIYSLVIDEACRLEDEIIDAA